MELLSALSVMFLFSWTTVGLSETSHEGEVYFDEQRLGNGQYVLKWGVRGKFENTSDPIEFPRFDNTGLYCLGDSVITLTYSCGTSCTGAIMLPVFAGATELQTDAFLAADCNIGVYAYLVENQSDSSIVYLRDIREHVRASTTIGDFCPSIQAACIDTAYFSDNSFCIAWHTSRWASLNGGLNLWCADLP